MRDPLQPGCYADARLDAAEEGPIMTSDEMLSDLAMIAATLAKEMHSHRLLVPLASKAIAGALDRIADELETDDPEDPQDLDGAAAVLHSTAMLLRRDTPESPTNGS